MGFATIIPFSVVSTLCPSTLPSSCLLLGHKIHLKSWLTKSHTLIVLIGVENINVTFLRHYYFSILHILHVCSARLLNLIYFSDLLFCLTISSWLDCCFNFCIPVFPHVCLCLQLSRIRWWSCLEMCRGAHFSARRDVLVPTCHLSLPFQPE